MMNKVIKGIAIGLGSELAVGLLLWIVLAVTGMPVASNVTWFGGCLIPLVFFVRHYAKKKDEPELLKTLISILFISTLAFFWCVMKWKGSF